MSFCIVKLVLVHFRYVRASQRYGNYHPPISPLKTVSLFAISYDASGFGYMCHFCNRICTFPNHIFSEVSQPSLKVLFADHRKQKFIKSSSIALFYFTFQPSGVCISGVYNKVHYILPQFITKSHLYHYQSWTQN